MRKIIVLLTFVFLIFLNTAIVFALQQVAGPLVITVSAGGSNSAKYGLVNDGNETITISLRAEGDVVPYLSFPATVDLPPKKLVYTDIVATIPKNYDTSLGGNLNGWLYALQKGEAGQVQINVQMKKNVTMIIPELPAVSREMSVTNDGNSQANIKSGNTQITQSSIESNQETTITNTGISQTTSESPIESNQLLPTGFFALAPLNYFVVAIAAFCLVGIIFFVIIKRR